MKRLFPKLVGVVLVVGGIALAAASVPYWSALKRFSAEKSEGNIWDTPPRDGSLSIWVYTPYVSPGDHISARVAVYGGLKAAIDSGRVTLGTRKLQLQGRGKSWGQQIKIDRKEKDDAQGSDDVDFEIDVSDNAVVGETLPLRCEVACTIAQVNPDQFRTSFTEESVSRSIEIPLLIRPPWQTILWRGLKAGQALGLFVLALLFFRWFPVKLADWIAQADEARANSTGNVNSNQLLDRVETGAAAVIGVLSRIAFLAWGLIYGYIGYLVFALPMLAATSLTSTWFCCLLVALWVGGAFVAFCYFPLPQRQPPETTSPLSSGN